MENAYHKHKIFELFRLPPFDFARFTVYCLIEDTYNSIHM